MQPRNVTIKEVQIRRSEVQKTVTMWHAHRLRPDDNRERETNNIRWTAEDSVCVCVTAKGGRRRRGSSCDQTCSSWQRSWRILAAPSSIAVCASWPQACIFRSSLLLCSHSTSSWSTDIEKKSLKATHGNWIKVWLWNASVYATLFGSKGKRVESTFCLAERG